jgi:hypothetical protein
MSTCLAGRVGGRIGAVDAEVAAVLLLREVAVTLTKKEHEAMT